MFNFYVWKQESFWWLSWNGAYLGKDKSIWTSFEDLYCSKLQMVQYKRLTLSAASIFVIEGFFIYIYFLLFEENDENRISKSGEKVSPTILLFFRKMFAYIWKVNCAKGLSIEHFCDIIPKAQSWLVLNLQSLCLFTFISTYSRPE